MLLIFFSVCSALTHLGCVRRTTVRMAAEQRRGLAAVPEVLSLWSSAVVQTFADMANNQSIAEPPRRNVSSVAKNGTVSKRRRVVSAVSGATRAVVGVISRRRRRRERRSYLVNAELRRSWKETTVAEPVKERPVVALESMTVPMSIESLAQTVSSLRDNALLLSGSLSRERSDALDVAMAIEEYEATEVAPLVSDDLASSPQAAPNNRFAPPVDALEARMDIALGVADALAQETTSKLPIDVVAGAALSVRSRGELGRFCRDSELMTGLVDAVVGNPNDVLALDALAHIVALDSASSRDPIVKGGPLVNQKKIESGDVAEWLCRRKDLIEWIGRLLESEDTKMRRSTVRLALRLAAHVGGGDVAVEALRANGKLRRYLRRMARTADDPERARARVKAARNACSRAVAFYEAEKKGDEAKNETSVGPPPTPSAAYWRRSRGLLSPPIMRNLEDKELRDALKLNAVLGLRRLSPRVGVKRRRRRGVRVLCLDGGGTRGVITIELLRQLQKRCFDGHEPHEVFDLVVGTSTGAILAVLLGAKHCALDVAADMYDQLVSRIFVKKTVRGSTSLVLRRAYYDERDIETVFDELLGDDDCLDAAEPPRTPAVACLATLLSVAPAKICLLRNYDYPPKPHAIRRLVGAPRKESRYAGSCRLPIRDALRAATAAPTLFTPITLRNQLLCDGALISNNPTAVAIHEAAALFPGRPLECVVSVGTGEMEVVETKRADLTWEAIVAQLVDSATSTSLVHEFLSDMAPKRRYWRFNPDIPPSPIDATDASALAAFRKYARDYFDSDDTKKRADSLRDKLRISRPDNDDAATRRDDASSSSWWPRRGLLRGTALRRPPPPQKEHSAPGIPEEDTSDVKPPPVEETPKETS